MTSTAVAHSVAEILSSLFRLRKIIEYRLENFDEVGGSAERGAASELTSTLQDGVKRIHAEFGKGLGYVGPKYVNGDGPENITLASIVLPLRDILSRISRAGGTNSAEFAISDYRTWTIECFQVVKDSITTLAQLYQRTLPIGLIPKSQEWNHPWFDEAARLGRFGLLRNASFGLFDPNSKYKGTALKDTRLRHGRGVEIWKNGDRYDGGWKDDEMHGYGILTRQNGNVYKGDFEKNTKQGAGILLQKDGCTYTYHGHWQNNKRSGYGLNYWPNGKFYRGEWAEDSPSGFGVMRLAASQLVVGSFERNFVHGYALCILADGSHYAGQWVRGERHGFGIGVSQSGGYYDGEWKADQYHGRGVLVMLSGEKYEGEWENGKKHGFGIRTIPGLLPEKGQWHEDCFASHLQA